MPRQVSILHFDDQPELASWIPRHLSSWFWKHFYDEALANGCDEENDAETEFRLFVKIGEDELVIEYRIFSDTAQLDEILTKAGSTIALIVLDQTFSGNSRTGGNAYRQIAAKFPDLLKRVVFLTAYPNSICCELGWSVRDPRLVIKARSTPQVIIAKVVEGLSDFVSNSLRDRLRSAIERDGV